MCVGAVIFAVAAPLARWAELFPALHFLNCAAKQQGACKIRVGCVSCVDCGQDLRFCARKFLSSVSCVFVWVIVGNVGGG